MATEIATLKFKADTSDLARAERMLVRLGGSAREAANDYDYLTKEQRDQERQQKRNNKEMKAGTGVMSKMGKAAAGLAAGFSAISAASKLIDVAREFDVINASLVTMTGSTEAAQDAFAQIQQFATTTPYDLAQVANAFVKLKAMGLDPSEAALESYGNTAAAMGKSLDQMVEAVADAATGEFERLKEFGIRASSEGDRVKFTFRGVETTVRKNSEAIQGYLLGLGQVEFAGAMQDRSETLDGALSNLADSWDNLFLTIANAGVADLIEDTARSTIKLLDATSRLIKLAGGDQLEGIEALNNAREVRNELLEKQAFFEKLGGTLPVREQERLDATNALIKSLKLQLSLEQELAEREAQEGITSGTGATTGPAAKDAPLVDPKVVRAQEALAQMMQLNETELEESKRIEQERLDAVQALRDADLISAQELQNAKTEIEAAGEAERAEIRARHREEERQRINEENEAAFEAEEARRDLEAQAQVNRDAQEVERRQAQRDGLNAIEDVFFKNASEREKKAFQLTKGLMDSEKRDRAKEIVSKSYSAAMSAYEALAPIPIIGPALGAAAAAATLALGVQYAAQSLSGRALGGQVRAGESYVVGERGPEVLTMGNAKGFITPNESLRGGQAPMVNRTANVSFSIQANDTRGFDELLVERRNLIISVINDALNDSGRTSLV